MTAPVPRLSWRYTFCDLLTRIPLARLPLVDAELGETLNGPADGSGTIPLTPQVIRDADPWTATQQRRTLCFAQRVLTAGDLEVAAPALWAGIVWKRERSDRSLKLSMSTVESYWARRLVHGDQTFGAVDDATIQRALLTAAEAQSSGGLGIAMGTNAVGTISDRTVLEADLKTVLEIMQSVAKAAPMEWRIVPGVNAGTGAFTLTLVQDRRLGADLSDRVVWVSSPGTRQANEVMGYSYVEDGANVPNSVTGLGGTPPGQAQLRSTVTSAALGPDELALGWPLLESALGSATDEIRKQPTLDRHTRQELAVMRANEVQVTGLTVRGDRGWTTERYGVGDTIGLRFSDELHPSPVETVGRITARTIRPAQPGRSESVAMTLAAPEPVTLQLRRG